jgi:exo-beta-1,3-glucanase (GH17 family)
MKHWYELGMAQPTDQCACYADTAVTSAPGPGTPSTAAPSGTLMQKFINAMTPTTTSPGSISFSACVAPYSPWSPPPLNLMKQLLSNLVSTTNYRTIMVYSLDQYIAQVAASLGVKVLGIIYLTNDYTANAANIANGVYAAKTYPDTVLAVACGNENGQNYGPTAQTASFINNCISSVRQAGVKQPVGCIDTPSSWIQSGGKTWSDVAKNVDWIGANIYPWFDNVYMNPPYTCKTPQNVGTYTYSMYQSIENAYPGKPVFLTESGWPSSPGGSTIRSTPNVVNGQQCTTAGDSDQRIGVQNIVNVFRQNMKPMNLFSGYKEAWKSSGNDYSVEEYWGVCSGSPPYACFNAPK